MAPHAARAATARASVALPPQGSASDAMARARSASQAAEDMHRARGARGAAPRICEFWACARLECDAARHYMCNKRHNNDKLQL